MCETLRFLDDMDFYCFYEVVLNCMFKVIFLLLCVFRCRRAISEGVLCGWCV